MNLSDLEKKTGLSFTNPSNIEKAFIHRSYLNESKKYKESNERLEYLGDAVLELATSKFLYQKYPKYQEGMLTNIRAALVRTTTLAEFSKQLDLNSMVLMSKGEEETGGRSNPSILANIAEAFIGALYLEQGLTAVNKVLKKYLFAQTEDVINKASYKDSKSLLQEIAQAEMKETPSYKLISQDGPDHEREFTMQVVINGKKYSTGKGKSKQLAQEDAARRTLEIITNT